MGETRQISHIEQHEIIYVDTLAFGSWSMASHAS